MVRRLILAILVTAAMAASAQTATPSAPPATASVFIRDLGDQAIRILQTLDLTLDQREAHFRNILRESFDLDFIGRFVLGNHWRQASVDQQSDYLELFGEYVLRTYSSRLGGYAGETLTILVEQPAGSKDVVVRTRIDRPSAPPINADWRVRVTGQRFHIIDIMVEGVSMVLTQRQEFTSLIQRNGVEGLLAMLRARVDKLPATASR